MERHLDQALARVREDLLRMAVTVEEMVRDAIEALTERDSEKAEATIARDQSVDAMEKQIDEAAQAILARHQPTAVDLRFLVTVMRINSDLERMGDSAVNICQSVEKLNREPQLKPYIDLPRLGELAREMIHESLEAFLRKDSALALRVTGADDKVDGLYKQIFRELLTYMAEDPRTVSRALHLLLIARNLERIADHATNIAEDVVFYVEGKDIRHPLL